MFNQKGQIHIIILVVLVVGFILYVNFSDRSLLKSLIPASPLKSTPAPGRGPSSPPRQTPAAPPAAPAPASPVSPTAPSGATPILEDKMPPVRSNPSHTDDVLPFGTREAVISISTDEPASCKYSTDSGMPYSSMSGSFSYYDQTKRFHVKTITGLADGKVYDFFVRCQDLKGNVNTGDVMIRFSMGPVVSPGATEQVVAPQIAPPQTASPPVRTSFFVKPYLVYPADKPMYPAYETAVRNYMIELQNWYKGKVGVTFSMAPIEVVRSSYNYQIMRCGEVPSTACLNDPSKLEGNWDSFMNKAVHNGVEKWEEETAVLIFSAGGGGYGGANLYSNYAGWAITGDWVLEPISGVVNTWGIPCSYSDGWQCSGGVPKGSPAHELGHAFGLGHPGEQYADQSIMQWHGGYPTVGLLPGEVNYLFQSPFFK